MALCDLYNLFVGGEEVTPVEYLGEKELQKIDELLESGEITQEEKKEVYRGRYAIFPLLPISSLGPVMGAVANGLFIDKLLPKSRYRLIKPKPLRLSERLFYKEMPVSYMLGIDLE